ncbi:MAG: hypothetical protein NZQ09_04115 [Chloroflexus sp.]|nr:hypothetical protein [Chloroflexus sp.]
MPEERQNMAAKFAWVAIEFAGFAADIADMAAHGVQAATEEIGNFLVTISLEGAHQYLALGGSEHSPEFLAKLVRLIDEHLSTSILRLLVTDY